jgi:hypothetical protein
VKSESQADQTSKVLESRMDRMLKVIFVWTDHLRFIKVWGVRIYSLRGFALKLFQLACLTLEVSLTSQEEWLDLFHGIGDA